MILLDTHIGMWWAAEPDRLDSEQQRLIRDHQPSGLGVSVISCWEIAKKNELGKLALKLPVAEWLEYALELPGIVLLPLSLEIVVESTQLPPPFHRDPADQLIVATARIHQIGLMTADDRIRQYPHVSTLP